VLVFLSDQESALLPGPVDLPHRRRLERGGARFTHAFCNTPQCSAARSALLTGLEPHQTGVLTNVDGGSLGKPLPPSLPNVGSVFRDAGYATGYFGKWHLGGGADLARFGFGYTGPPGRDDAVARAAAEWIRAQKTPWLAWVSVINPHDIYRLSDVPARPGVRPPASTLRDLAGKPREQQEYVDKDQGRATRAYSVADWVRYRSYYCELVEKVDAALGTVLDALPEPDTAVVAYTSDHGDALGEHGLPFKGPFMYEELIRIPLVIHAPGRLAGGRRDDLVTQADLAPTLAALAAVPWPARVAGRNLSRGPALGDAVFLEYYAKQKWVNPIRTVRTRRWKLNWYDRGNQELYDLEADPHERHNRAADPAAQAIRSQLEARLDGWRKPLLD
jgi:arylsulfatase A-like enzyme